jgi:hypothetical protein
MTNLWSHSLHFSIHQQLMTQRLFKFKEETRTIYAQQPCKHNLHIEKKKIKKINKNHLAVWKYKDFL